MNILVRCIVLKVKIGFVTCTRGAARVQLYGDKVEIQRAKVPLWRTNVVLWWDNINIAYGNIDKSYGKCIFVHYI